MSVIGYLFLDSHAGFSRPCLPSSASPKRCLRCLLRKIGFDYSAPERQGQVQGQMASALGIGFTLGPLLGGFIGKWLGAERALSALRRARSARAYSRPARRRAPLSSSRHGLIDDSMARRHEPASQTRFSRFLSRHLPVVLFSRRRDPRGFSISRRKPARHRFGSGRHHGGDFPPDRHLRPL